MITIDVPELGEQSLTITESNFVDTLLNTLAQLQDYIEVINKVRLAELCLIACYLKENNHE